MILPKFPKNCMKLRKFWAVGGGGHAGGAPLDPPLVCRVGFHLYGTAAPNTRNPVFLSALLPNFEILGSESFTRWFVLGTSTSTRELGKNGMFCILTACKCLKFKICFYHLVVFECPYHLTLSAPLKLHSFSSKIIISRSPPPPKILWQKGKSIHYGDSNEPPINNCVS